MLIENKTVTASSVLLPLANNSEPLGRWCIEFKSNLEVTGITSLTYTWHSLVSLKSIVYWTYKKNARRRDWKVFQIIVFWDVRDYSTVDVFVRRIIAVPSWRKYIKYKLLRICQKEQQWCALTDIQSHLQNYFYADNSSHWLPGSEHVPFQLRWSVNVIAWPGLGTGGMCVAGCSLVLLCRGRVRRQPGGNSCHSDCLGPRSPQREGVVSPKNITEHLLPQVKEALRRTWNSDDKREKGGALSE